MYKISIYKNIYFNETFSLIKVKEDQEKEVLPKITYLVYRLNIKPMSGTRLPLFEGLEISEMYIHSLIADRLTANPTRNLQIFDLKC